MMLGEPSNPFPKLIWENETNDIKQNNRKEKTDLFIRILKKFIKIQIYNIIVIYLWQFNEGFYF